MQRVNCFGCVYHFITYEPSNPYGCKFYGFKSKKSPSIAVFESSGKHCQAFTPKPQKK